MFLGELRVSSFPVTFPYHVWTVYHPPPSIIKMIAIESAGTAIPDTAFNVRTKAAAHVRIAQTLTWLGTCAPTALDAALPFWCCSVLGCCIPLLGLGAVRSPVERGVVPPAGWLWTGGGEEGGLRSGEAPPTPACGGTGLA